MGYRSFGGICIISFNDLINGKTWQHKQGQVEGAARSLREYCAWVKKHVRAFAFVSIVDGQAWDIRDFATFNTEALGLMDIPSTTFGIPVIQDTSLVQLGRFMQ